MNAISSAALRPHEWSATIWTLLLTTATAALFKVFWRPAFPKNAPKWYRKGDWPIIGAVEFYYGRRADYMKEALRDSKTGNFSFYIGKKQLVGVSGVEGRKLFFESKDLNFPQAFAELLAGQPQAPEQHGEGFSQVFQKALVPMMKKENFVKNLDLLTGDTRRACEALAAAPIVSKEDDGSEWRVTDPFESFYEIVYQLTMRTVGANDIADDPKLLKHTLSIFDWFERSNSYVKIIFPWLPTLNHYMRMYYGAKLAFVFKDLIDKRKKTGKKGNDALQFLIDRDLSLTDIVGFEIGALFAGQLNSGINAGYLQIFLTQTPEWYARLREEVDGVIARRRAAGASGSRAAVLSSLTIDEWESEFPLIDLALRETIRFCLPGATFRKNMSGHDIPIGNSGEVIPNGAFAIFLVEDSLFGDWYNDKDRWNPSRFFEENAEDKKTPHGYIGWGSGRHPCCMKFAKLEMAFITAYWVGMFDFELSDKNGNRVAPDGPLKMDRNNHSAKKPEKNMYLRYKLRED